MEITVAPNGRTIFRHSHPVNDGRFAPSLFYYEMWDDLPVDYFTTVSFIPEYTEPPF